MSKGASMIGWVPGSSRIRPQESLRGVVTGFSGGWIGPSAGIRVESRRSGTRKLKSPGSSAAVDGHIVPEDGICGGSHPLSLAGREGGHESLQFVGKQSGRWWRAWRMLPQIQVLEDLSDDGPLCEEGKDLHRTSAAGA